MDVSCTTLDEEKHKNIPVSKLQKVMIWPFVSVVQTVSAGAETHRHVLSSDDGSSLDTSTVSPGSSCPCPTLPPAFNYCDLLQKHLLQASVSKSTFGRIIFCNKYDIKKKRKEKVVYPERKKLHFLILSIMIISSKLLSNFR